MSDKFKVLVVDDQEAMRNSLVNLMKSEGYLVEEAVDGASALKIAEEFQPDLVLLDVILPDKNGLEVARDLKAGETTRHAFIIHITAQLTHEANLGSVRESVADDYLLLPLSRNEIAARVRTFLYKPGAWEVRRTQVI